VAIPIAARTTFFPKPRAAIFRLDKDESKNELDLIKEKQISIINNLLKRIKKNRIWTYLHRSNLFLMLDFGLGLLTSSYFILGYEAAFKSKATILKVYPYKKNQLQKVPLNVITSRPNETDNFNQQITHTNK
jgi:hypothetical protein